MTQFLKEAPWTFIFSSNRV